MIMITMSVEEHEVLIKALEFVSDNEYGDVLDSSEEILLFEELKDRIEELGEA